MQAPKIKLISFNICPYVHRIRFALEDTAIQYGMEYVDPYDRKPQWLLDLSPQGKVPVIIVNDEVVYESDVILEYINDLCDGRLLPPDPLMRARYRAFITQASKLQSALSAVFSAGDEDTFAQCRHDFQTALHRLDGAVLESRLHSEGFDLVDYSFGPAFHLAKTMEKVCGLDLLSEGRLKEWSERITKSTSFKRSIDDDYLTDILKFFVSKKSYFSILSRHYIDLYTQ